MNKDQDSKVKENIDQEIANLANSLIEAHCEFKNDKVAKLITDSSETLKLRDSKGNTVLHLVAGSDKAVTGAIIKPLVDANKEMLDAQNKEGKTPLMLGCEHFCFGVVETLMRLNADIKIKDTSGKTAYDYAGEVMREKLLTFHYPSRFESKKEEITTTPDNTKNLDAECSGEIANEGDSD